MDGTGVLEVPALEDSVLFTEIVQGLVHQAPVFQGLSGQLSCLVFTELLLNAPKVIRPGRIRKECSCGCGDP
jgi:hypothetical protein